MTIHNKEGSIRKRAIFVSLGTLLAVAGALFLPGHALAQSVAMSDSGTTANIDFGSSAGMNNWSVNGQNQLNQQWFWYQTDGGIAKSIDTISAPTIYTSTGPSGINDVLSVYQNSQLTLSIEYTLSGGGVGSGNADITESIMAVNNSGSLMHFNFYQYSNFRLLGGIGGDTVQIFGSPGAYNFVRQANGSTAISEAVTSPDALYAEAALTPQTLNELNTVSGLTLNGNLTAGPGDPTWALQWYQDLNPGDEFDLTKDKSLAIATAPEPSTMALIALGAGALGLARRRKRA